MVFLVLCKQYDVEFVEPKITLRISGFMLVLAVVLYMARHRVYSLPTDILICTNIKLLFCVLVFIVTLRVVYLHLFYF